MLYNNIKLYLITCITVILLVNPAIAAEDKKTSNNNHYTIYLRHPLDFINRPFSAFDYYWNSIFDDRLSIYDSSAIKSKFIPQDKQYILVLEVPGYDKSHIKLKVNNHKLFIEGKIDDTKANSATDHLNKKFNYVMSLYDDIDQKAIASQLKNGILTITLPRIAIKDQDAKEIPIQ
ncbi:Hsp20/alpha crystallin family protein (plasmid) [Rickettsia tamurae subsp. buchneri]|uniref:Hsp20/alpha crystallin family protein n=1 Tax=Rickettsia tamurae subsp. buchneri TaxID=1462938 RepID=A0A8E0WKE7_9RICK|nr:MULTISPECIES: Hsp20/alpha crystallin family protein [spotted fever group]EER20846.1 small heat shock protein [Rickettsia endosymbiont of Ixodes scapularis]EER20898.1 small heat shock protein [Rickettsia endosymbiont of Ixodes scapularis]KDO02181.1 Hsp20/alpha crystallin family protein [Rickettsia tamurae subsp. buchneri]KDO02252.1 Hsp20/alpha crystallin family protein [Rickettsia tamurae subsp. buchneri]